MDSPPLLLVCDHRGHGWPASLAALTERGYRLAESASLLQSLRSLAAGRPALVLFDPLNPGGRVEYEALDAARRGEPAVPVLVVADAADPVALRRAEECLHGGPWDWVWREASAEELRLRVARLLQVRRAHEEMLDLRHRAAHDDRTDLLRPQAFQTRLAEHFSAAQRHGLELAFVLLDLDRFGQINKRHDHTVGDALIARVGEAIKKTIRTEDVAGRLGGDEFAVILPYTGKPEAAQVVKRLRDAIHRLSGTLATGASGKEVALEVSASIGFETFDGRDLKSSDELRAHAESALRAAKERGGDQALYFRGMDEGLAPATPAETP